MVALSLGYCFPGPSVGTLDLKKPPPMFNNGPHLYNLMLLLTLLDTLDGIPSYEANRSKKYFTCIHYDAMPLNIGTFPRLERGKVVFDGIQTAITLERIEDLYKKGNVAVHKFIKENCARMSEVKEYDMMDASGTVNVCTYFGTSTGDSETVKNELSEALKCFQSCIQIVSCQIML